ncbi:Dabb family protein [Salinispora arenicola]|uniref:Dabb family protein n=1 Tax=Salinispora arenicola TaxID=168697 RepID=UPI001696E388|nr:Dabb family protein [Salinispora arenicola]NIL60071.1 Dabb family protein [Salinispora arenicola]
MITHIVLFKLKDGIDRDARQVTEAVELAREVGRNVPDSSTGARAGTRSTGTSPTTSPPSVCWADLVALQRYQENAFHRAAIEKWRPISDWVVADLADH